MSKSNKSVTTCGYKGTVRTRSCLPANKLPKGGQNVKPQIKETTSQSGDEEGA